MEKYKWIEGSLQIESGNQKILFRENGCGFPEQVWLKTASGMEIPQFKSPDRMELELVNGRVLFPVIGCLPQIESFPEKTLVEFARLDWADAAGNIEPDFYLFLRHEFWADGTAFTTAFFNVEKNIAPQIKRFELHRYPDFTDCRQLNWEISPRPYGGEGPLVQAMVSQRFMSPGQNIVLESGIMADVKFVGKSDGGQGRYAEFFVEGDNVLAGNRHQNSSFVKWQDQSPEICWQFQKGETPHRRLPLQWRNTLGWVLKTAPTERKLPPVPMYHYFDFVSRYPDAVQLEKLYHAGCRILIIHENWRRDVQNEGIPADPERFSAMLEQAHGYGIRVAVYIRGNELSAAEESCSWFRRYLKPDWDGLYIDYGSPFEETAPPDTSYHSGRICFRRHYLKMLSLRRMVGENGLMFYHTGPMFSALGSSVMNGYVSGEGEQGILVQGRQEHEYFSMAYSGLGTMWTAAFPEYSSPVMVPFLAATGQFSHNPLGVQFGASSLIHPLEPGINDQVFQLLWRIWSCFADETDLNIYNDFNGMKPCRCDNPEIGFYAMSVKSEKKALLTFANFSSTEQKFSFSLLPDSLKTAFSGHKLWLSGTAEQPAASSFDSERGYETILPPYGVGAILVCDTPTELEHCKADFLRKQPELGEYGKKYIAELEQQRLLRTDVSECQSLDLFVKMPFYYPLPFEDELIIDLYNIELQLGVICDGEFRALGWIGKDGFQTVAVSREKQLEIGESTPRIDLASILGPGCHQAALRSRHLGEKFYSFFEAQLIPDGDMDRTYTIEFRNELEPDRAFLRWMCRIK